MSDNEELLPVISLWQPWATWILWGWKTIETRTHPRFASLAGKRIGIHAAKRVDPQALVTAARYLTPKQISATQNAHHARGALIGVAHVERFVTQLRPQDSCAALIECETPRSGLVLRAVTPLPHPVAMRGRQGIWRVRL